MLSEQRSGDLENRRFAGMLNKVPEVTLAFWIIKIMSTTVGETGADYLAVHVGLGTLLTDAIMLTALVASLLLQLRARQYVPWRYWLTVVLVSVVGTQITDFLTDGLDVSLYISTIVFGIALVATFAIWFHREQTLSIHSIVTPRRELFYWAAVLFTFALGTAAGDLATEGLQLGFQLGVVIFGTLIAVTALAYFYGADAVLTFWIAYALGFTLSTALELSAAEAQEATGTVPAGHRDPRDEPRAGQGAKGRHERRNGRPERRHGRRTGEKPEATVPTGTAPAPQ
jgi:uncharacterized membrane-anchored protein